jgi:hypothetical protein
MRFFRQRPEPELFNELAISIARAAAYMSKLTYIHMEFDAFHRDNSNNGIFEYFKGYEGCAFYFRFTCNVEFALKSSNEEFLRPVPDFTTIKRPQTEWVFHYPYLEAQWEELNEAKALRRERFPDINLDPVTMDYDVDSGY